MKTQATVTDPELVIPLPLDLTGPERLNAALDLSWLADCPQQDPDFIPEAMSTLARLSDASSSSSSSVASTQAPRLAETLLPSIDLSRSTIALSPRLVADPIVDVGERRAYVQGVELSSQVDIGCQESAPLIASPVSLATNGQTCYHKVRSSNPHSVQ